MTELTTTIPWFPLFQLPGSDRVGCDGHTAYGVLKEMLSLGWVGDSSPDDRPLHTEEKVWEAGP